MAWQNPKTNWQAGDIPGAGDFNRIEGNTEYLKGQTDGLKNGSIVAGKAINANNADTVDGYHASEFRTRIAALESGEVMPKGVLLRAVPSDAVILEANTQRSVHKDSGLVPVKEFVLKYPGTYRFKCELRRTYDPGGSASAFYTVSISGGNDNSAYFSNDDWQPINFEISTGAYGSVVRVSMSSSLGYAYIRNVKICGTLTMAEPEYAVLLN